MISVNNLSISFGGRKLFKEVSFQINPGDKIGLVGNNGAGKTTLLKTIIGCQAYDSGNIEKPSDITIGYLPQQMNHKDDKTLYQEARKAFSNLLELEREIEELNMLIAERTDYDSQDYLNLANKLAEANTRMDHIGASKTDKHIESTLLGLGFSRNDFERHTSEFSGGWRMRIELAKLLLKKPDLLLLDEPTNHLDILSIQWMEQFLTNFNSAIVLISHDKLFLDTVTNRTIEISLGNIYDYKVPYSKYLVLREERRKQQLAAYKNQQREIAASQRYIERFRYKDSKASGVQSRIKQLKKMERIEIEEEDTSVINIRFPDAPRSGKIVMEGEKLSKKFGENVVFADVCITLERGQRAAFIGKNGEGKTTLSRIIVGELDYSGQLKIGHNVDIGYFAQNQDQILDENKTVFDTIAQSAIDERRNSIRSLLGVFLFKEDDIHKKVKVLSGGERSRLALIKLLLKPFSLLVLDEPTNHLDMRSKDILKRALKKYKGTLILVSHDREFLEGLIDRVYEFTDHKVIKYLGGVYDFLQKKKIESLRHLEIGERKSGNQNNNNKASGREEYAQRKNYSKKLQKAKKSILDNEKEIKSTEDRLIEIEMKIEKAAKKGEVIQDQSIFLDYGNLTKYLDKLIAKSGRLNQELAELKKSKYYREIST